MSPPPTATIPTQAPTPLRFADGYATVARVFSFDGFDGREHLALGVGDRAAAVMLAAGGPAPLVRLHSESSRDVFATQRCDCGPQLREAVERISDFRGFLLFLRQEGRGIGRVALISNNPDKARQLHRFGVTVAARVPTAVRLTDTNARLVTKAQQGAHTLDISLSAG